MSGAIIAAQEQVVVVVAKKYKSLVDQLKKEKLHQMEISREWYSLRSMLGYSWALFLFLLGGREAGKSYAVTSFFVRQWKTYGRPFYWLRLTETSQKKLLQNRAEKLIDPDIRRAFKLDLVTNGDGVYEVLERTEGGKVKKKKLMGRVLALATFYNDKGSGLFDKDFLNDPKMYYNICLDEMNREKNEKKSFDIVYAFANQLENLVRSTKQRLRVFCIGNTLEEASDLLCAFNFLPEKFGRYKLKSKRAVIEYIEPSERYLERRRGTVADILAGDESTFTNKVEVDSTLIYKGRLEKPSFVIKFNNEDMFTLWDSKVISLYHNERVRVIPMRPYLDEVYNVEMVNNVIGLYDNRMFCFRNLITQKKFKKALELLKPRKS